MRGVCLYCWNSSFFLCSSFGLHNQRRTTSFSFSSSQPCVHCLYFLPYDSCSCYAQYCLCCYSLLMKVLKLQFLPCCADIYSIFPVPAWENEHAIHKVNNLCSARRLFSILGCCILNFIDLLVIPTLNALIPLNFGALCGKAT